jgi:hypothetical protein
MAYRKLESAGDFFKFTEPGDTLEGQWRGIKEGKYGKNGVVFVDGKPRIFSLNAMLTDLEFVDVGTQVKIVLVGEQPSKGGMHPMKVFEIYVEDSKNPDLAPENVPFKATDDDVPF